MEQTRSAAARPARNTVVDLVRAVAIAMVIGSHYFVFTGLYGPPAGSLGRAVGYLFRHGYYGVTIFFVVSGFLITSTSARLSPHDTSRDISIDIAKFYIRRATRILPLLFVALLIGAGFLLATAGVDTPRTEFVFHARDAVFDTEFWVSILLFLFNWMRIAHAGISEGWGLHWDVLWSLAVEEQFYAVFPMLILLCRRLRRLRLVLGVAVVVALLTRAWLLHAQVDRIAIFNNSLCCIDSLALGALVALSPVPTRQATRRGYALAGGLLSVIGFVISDYQFGGIGTTLLSAGIAALLQMSRTPQPAPGPAGGRRGDGRQQLLAIPARFGQLSFGLYLLHPLVLFVLIPLLVRLPQPAAVTLYFVTCFLVAQISFTMFESPVERVLRRRLIGSSRVRLAMPLL